jgi:hypothetical protein
MLRRKIPLAFRIFRADLTTMNETVVIAWVDIDITVAKPNILKIQNHRIHMGIGSGGKIPQTVLLEPFVATSNTANP